MRSGIRAFVYVLSAICFLTPQMYGQVDQRAMSICTGLYGLDYYDSSNVMSAEQTFQQVQNTIKAAHMSSYSDLQNSEKSLGGNFSDLEDAIGLSASAKTNSGVFMSELNTFLNSSFASSGQQNYFLSNSTTINQGMINVISTCISQYFNHVDSLQLGVTIAPGYTTSSVTIRANIPGNPHANLKILGYSPTDTVKCTLNGKEIDLNQDLGVPTALLECKKNPAVQVNNLVFNTNAGVLSAASLPAKDANSPDGRPAPPPLPPKPIAAIWQPNLPDAGSPIVGHCTCVAISYTSKQAILSNRCGAAVDAIAVKRTNWYLNPYPFENYPANVPDVYTPPPLPASLPITPVLHAAESYASVNIPDGRDASFDISDATSGFVAFPSCPATNAPGALVVARQYYLLPSVSSLLACVSEKGTPQNPTGRSVICDANGANAGNACSCTVPSIGAKPAKTYSGKATRLNCQDGATYKPCDF